MHATLALANGQSVTGRVKNSDVTRQSEMGVRVKPEAFANAPAVEYYHAQTGWRIDERDILQMSLFCSRTSSCRLPCAKRSKTG